MPPKTFSQRFVPEDISEKPFIPERNLLVACLERACRDLLNKPQSEGSNRELSNHCCREACAWLRSQATSEFSFKWICYWLDLDPVIIRRKLYEMRSNGERYECRWSVE